MLAMLVSSSSIRRLRRGPLVEEDLAAIEALHPEWVYFGTLTQTHPPALATLDSLLHRLPSARRFYDMNLREGHWNFHLVQCLLKTHPYSS